MTDPIQPIVPEGTPLPTPPVGVPPFPITPFSVWTWSTPVIPSFYWNIYSSEQRIKAICKEIGRIEAYLQYLVTKVNENFIEVHKRIDVLTERVAQLEEHVAEEVARLDDLIAKLRADLEQEIHDREAGDTALGDRIDEEIDDRQAADGVLHTEIAQEVEDRIHGDDQLHAEISTETQARIHADDALGERIDAEAQSRQAADANLHGEIAAEATTRAHGDEQLHTEISQETQDRIHADSALESKLEAELQAETDMRQEEDATLRSAISTEETARKAADATLGQRITQEIADREAGDAVLDTKIATEAHEREAGDDQLASDLEAEVSAREAGDSALRSDLTAEVSAREAGDSALETKIAKRLLPTEVQAGEEIEITRPDPNKNTIVISSTVAHSISSLETLITSLQAALTAETAERRADDGALWTAVNNRIERGKILAGAGIRVDNDPDASTVTISGTSTVEGTAPVEVSGTPGEGYTVSVNAATETKSGVITEARVKALAPGTDFSMIKNANDTYGVRFTPATDGEWGKSSDTIQAELSSARGVRRYVAFSTSWGANVKEDFIGAGIRLGRENSDSYMAIGVAAGQGLEIGESSSGERGRLRVKTATEDSAGIISEARVKELAGTVVPNLSAESPLKLEDGTLSALPYPRVEGEGPVKVESRSASRPGGEETGMTYSVGVDAATEDTAGVITEARVKELIAEALAAQAQKPTE